MTRAPLGDDIAVAPSPLGSGVNDPLLARGPRGPAPEHQLDGKKIRFRNPDNSWGAWLDTKGDQGVAGELTPAAIAAYGAIIAAATQTGQDAQTTTADRAAVASDKGAVAALLGAFYNAFLGRFASDAAANAFAAATNVTVSDGLVYENTTSDKLRIYVNTDWADYDASAQQQNAAAALSAANAATAKVAAESARDLASGFKSSTQTLFDSVSALALQVAGNKTSAEAAAASASAVSGLSNLSAAAKAIVTASDVTAVFIYDTTRDTDGGVWGDKCVDKSWMIEALNTATRGATARRPQRMLIVGQSTGPKFSIYDLSDPACPLWLSVNGGALTYGVTVSAIYALNGAVYFGGSNGLFIFDFIADEIRFVQAGNYRINGNIASRGVAQLTGASGNFIVNNTINDISAAVTPLTPLNPLRCGLPNPTVAVATMGGVSVVRHDGAVANVTHTSAGYSAAYKVTLTPTTLSFVLDAAASVTGRYSVAIPVPSSTRTVSMAVGSSDALAGTLVWGAVSPNLLMVASNSSNGVQAMISAPRGPAFGSGLGLSMLMRDPANAANSAIAYVTTAYATGYMPGGTKIALAESSAALANLVGGTATDRSGAGNNAPVVGTLNRSVVAAGADLAAYSGFSAANYMELPYGAAFDPGAGDLQLMAEVALTVAAGHQVTLIDRSAAGGGAYYRLDTDASGKPRFTISDGANVATAMAPAALPAGAHCVRGIRRTAASRIELEVDGVVVATASAAAVGSLNNATAVLRIGQAVAGGAPMDIAGPGIARVQVAISAPSLDQIAAMWAIHAPQYAANAKSLIAGSTNVQGLAYDADTDQLAVATASGTNLFKGLVRVGLVNVAGVNDNAKLSSDNHKAVAFSNGDLIVASAAQVFGSLLATSGLRETAKKRAAVPAYDPTFGTFSGVTTDATPLDLFQIPIAEGRMVRFRAAVTAQIYGGAMTERGAYIVEGKAYRPYGGSVAVSSVTTTISETTSTMDVTAAANTTAQTSSGRVTGKAATRMVWSAQVETYDVAVAA